MADNKPDFGAPGTASHDAETLIVVGVGASAGGLEALTELMRHIPGNTGMAFVLVQHLDPNHESSLPELLETKTPMPVLQVQTDTLTEPNHVYIIAPNTLMRIQNRSLTLETRARSPEKFRPIDVFFESLSQDRGTSAVGIVLSGTASDGTLGLKAIKAEGGVTFAQNQTAKFDSMPRSAIAAGVVDFVLSPRRIAEELVAIAQRTVDLRQAVIELVGDGTTFYRLLLLLRKSTGVDFAQYKQPTILRRLNRRILVRKADSLERYFELLQKEPEEVKALFDDLLINVTDFFRDPDVFETARRLAFPSLTKDRKPPYTVRAWIPGCSSGEEVYSLAIALVEYFEAEDLECKLQLFGTDLSEGTIAHARAGVYGEPSVLNVSPERLRRFFVRTDAGYQISRMIREMCVFSRHNVVQDPPLSRMDLISCRNVLIYLSPNLQRRAISMFAYALQPGGCLILGTSESLGNLADNFVSVDEPSKIYLRKPTIVQHPFQLSENVPGDYAPPQPAPAHLSAEPNSEAHVHRYVDQLVLSRYGPAGVVVTQDLRIVEYRGDVGRYLADGFEHDADLTSAIRQELRTPASNAIEEARRTKAAVISKGLPAPGSDGSALTAVTVIPLPLTDDALHFLVLFGPPREAGISQEGAASFSGEVEVKPAPLSTGQENVQLKLDLKTTREYLQSVIEELRSTNEEAQSANEELQSTNEEMQTSKEELQSSNEELSTINEEMQSRNAELAELNNDLINLLGSINVPIVMTGNDLRIRRFTPTAEKVLRLIATDIGRPITDLKPRIDVPNLEEILRQVLDSLQPYEREVQDLEGRKYLMRVRPYRTADNRIDGAVLQLLDVTELKRSLEEVRHARDYAEAIVNTVRAPLAVLSQALKVENANPAFYEVFGVSEPAIKGQSIYEVARRRFDLPKVHALLDQLNGDSAKLRDVEIELQLGRGESRLMALNARRIRTNGREQLVLLAFEDVTDRKRAAEARYRRLFESARDGILLADASTGEVFDLNPFLELLLGYTRNELIGRKLWDLEAVRPVPDVRALFEQLSDLGIKRFDDFILRTKDGRDLLTEVIANVYTEGDRRAIQFNIRDVSERKKFERELQETQKLEGLGLLAGGIAHDFNNLLTGIIGNASLAVSEVPADDPVRMYLRGILSAGERAAFLTRQMLAYAGKGQFITESIDLGSLVREITALVRTSIPRNVELKFDFAPDLPPIDADPGQMQQVIMNLVINGAEAIGENRRGTVEIRTSLYKLDEREASRRFAPEKSAGGVFVQLEVKDSGVGMDEATKARIFDPFFTTKFTGRGLGLAAVQGIIKGHGGVIRVYSTPGHGTTFLILLPAKRPKPVAAAPEKATAPPIPRGSLALVVDDEEPIRVLATNVLSRAGMAVLTAENGKVGVDLFRQHHHAISIVVLDLQMPVMGGEEALGILSEIDPDVPVILSSGFDQTEAARRFAGAKVALFLQKPYSNERLVEAVAAVVKQ